MISNSAQAEFHKNRIAQELAMADRAGDSVTAKLHRELARFHKSAAERNERPILRMAID
jgi:hypothetical protein